MGKNILIVSSSPRKNGNTELLCSEFARGAIEAGNTVDEINVSRKDIKGCMACEVCRKNGGKCVIKDDAAEIIDKIVNCDVLVLSSPVYFYSVTAQLKLLIDRMFAREHEMHTMAEKPAYLILASAGPRQEHMDTAIACLDGFIKCLHTVKISGIVRASGFMEAGSVIGSPVMGEAYEMGRNV